MSELSIPAAPQAFTFAGRALRGYLTSFSGQTPRRHVVHEPLKRKGAIIEDMDRGPRRLEVQLIFVGPTAAADEQAFEAAVDAQPKGLLVHPIGGRWQAFCTGPQSEVSFDTALNEVRVRVAWIENALDATLQPDVPDVATAAQEVTAQLSALQTATAGFMGAMSAAKLTTARAIAQVNDIVDQLANVATAPIDFVTEELAAVQGLGSNFVGRLNDVAVSMAVLEQNVNDFVAASTDLFNGDDSAAAGQATSVDTLLGNVTDAVAAAQAAFIALSPTPAGAAENVGQAEEQLAACIALSDALRASRPPVIEVLVPNAIDLVTLCQARYRENAESRALDVLALNRIPNPALIPGGTRLLLPAR